MSLIQRITSLFRRDTKPSDSGPRTLRNKPGGMAWVRGITELPELNGRYVTTVRIANDARWAIEPQQPVVCPAGLRTTEGKVTKAGDEGIVTAIADDCLEPIPDTGVTDEEVADLYAPKVRETL